MNEDKYNSRYIVYVYIYSLPSRTRTCPAPVYVCCMSCVCCLVCWGEVSLLLLGLCAIHKVFHVHTVVLCCFAFLLCCCVALPFSASLEMIFHTHYYRCGVWCLHVAGLIIAAFS